jgi:redox-sensitive bicupin YhaK (pirin superfamily)
MISRVPAGERHSRDFGWLKTFWLFSFDDYVDPNNHSFSSLRVFNDDVVAPHSGFPLHGHKEMEIVTVMLSGELTHEDSLGNRTAIRAGDIQRMTAGRGMRHSEFNHSDTPAHFYQLWIEPSERGLSPAFQEHNFLARPAHGDFEPLVSGLPELQAPLTIHAPVAIYRCALASGASVRRSCVGRSIFLYLTAGALVVNGIRVDAGDQLRIVAEEQLEIEAPVAAVGIMVDLP